MRERGERRKSGTQHYHRGLESVAAHYGLADNAFTRSVDHAIDAAAAALKKQKMDPEFLEAPGGTERGLFALAIADVQSDILDPRERKN